MSTMQTAADVPLQIRSPASASERRITPSWTISQLKARLEPITGIPAACQRLSLNLGGSQPSIAIDAADEDITNLAAFPLQPYAEIYVADTRPPALRHALTDVSSVEKYIMPAETYEALPDTVLAYKRAHALGRFDPAAPEILEQKAARSQREVERRGLAVGRRCRLLPDTDDRRGTVRFLGPVPAIPGVGAWVGVALDEPTGRNDGSVGGQRYFDAGANCGVFVRPERVEVGDFDVLDELGEEMEEI